MSILSEALYYGVKLLVCLMGLPVSYGVEIVETEEKQTQTHKPLLPILEGMNSPLGTDAVIVVVREEKRFH